MQWSDLTNAEIYTKEKLTPRQYEIINLASIGTTNKDIAKELCLSIRTVESHLYAIYNILDIHDRSELAYNLAEAKNKKLLLIIAQALSELIRLIRLGSINHLQTSFAPTWNSLHPTLIDPYQPNDLVQQSRSRPELMGAKNELDLNISEKNTILLISKIENIYKILTDSLKT